MVWTDWHAALYFVQPRTVLDGVGALGALLAGYAGEVDLARDYLLAGALAVVAAAQTSMLRFAPWDRDKPLSVGVDPPG